MSFDSGVLRKTRLYKKIILADLTNLVWAAGVFNLRSRTGFTARVGAHARLVRYAR